VIAKTFPLNQVQQILTDTSKASKRSPGLRFFETPLCR